MRSDTGRSRVRSCEIRHGRALFLPGSPSASSLHLSFQDWPLRQPARTPASSFLSVAFLEMQSSVACQCREMNLLRSFLSRGGRPEVSPSLWTERFCKLDLKLRRVLLGSRCHAEKIIQERETNKADRSEETDRWGTAKQAGCFWLGVLKAIVLPRRERTPGKDAAMGRGCICRSCITLSGGNVWRQPGGRE